MTKLEELKAVYRAASAAYAEALDTCQAAYEAADAAWVAYQEELEKQGSAY
jgi:hypothetical protein